MEHTDGGRLDHVADGEPLDGLVLGRASRAVAAADGVDVAAALLVAAVVLSLLDHLGGCLEVSYEMGSQDASWAWFGISKSSGFWTFSFSTLRRRGGQFALKWALGPITNSRAGQA
jgi:hypothetical protein